MKHYWYQIVAHTSDCDPVTDGNRDEADHYELYMASSKDGLDGCPRIHSFPRISEVARVIAGISIATRTHPAVGADCEFILRNLNREMEKFANITGVERIEEPGRKH